MTEISFTRDLLRLFYKQTFEGTTATKQRNNSKTASTVTYHPQKSVESKAVHSNHRLAKMDQWLMREGSEISCTFKVERIYKNYLLTL